MPTPKTTEMSAPETTQSPTDPKSSPDYRIGYKRGYKEGRGWEREVVGGGMPTPQGIRMMASHQASESGSKDESSWEDGWYDGFTDGYHGVKAAKISSSNLQPVSSANAKAGVKLYDHEGNYQVTITSVNQADGTITVKYPPSRGGMVESKSLTSLSSFWYVRVR